MRPDHWDNPRTDSLKKRIQRLAIPSLILLLLGCGSDSVAWSHQEWIANQPGRIPNGHTVVEAELDIRESPGVASSSAPFVSDQTLTQQLARGAESLGTPSTLATVQTALTFAVVGLAPMLILMLTGYVRLFVVLGMLRQALGAQQLPTNQMLMALSFFLTVLVMTPVWQEIKSDAIDPASRSDGKIDWNLLFERGVPPLKRFMARQVEIANNRAAVQVLYEHQFRGVSPAVELPENLDEVPLNALMPAFLISELKVAFLLGFQIYLPFLILDLVVASVTVSMGMVMLPPSMVSLPLKLILFVMVDGWNLVVGMLLQSFG